MNQSIENCDTAILSYEMILMDIEDLLYRRHVGKEVIKVIQF